MNIVQKTEKKIAQLKAERATELETISQKCEEARAQITEADRAQKTASEALNVEDYEAAKTRKRKAETALEMYSRRLDQIRAKEYLSEAESDSVIDELLNHEKEISERFKQEAGALAAQLLKVYEDYAAEIRSTEAIMTRWQNEIYANYRTFGRSYRTDPVTGQNVFRSDKPVAVHQMPYIGCPAALPGCLDKLAEMLKTGEAE